MNKQKKKMDTPTNTGATRKRKNVDIETNGHSFMHEAYRITRAYRLAQIGKWAEIAARDSFIHVATYFGRPFCEFVPFKAR